MKQHRAFTLALSGAAALLAGCGGSRPMPPATQGTLRALRAWHPRPHPQSWTTAGQSKADLLYVSNGNGEVTVYVYSTQALIGVLTDFTLPKGECSAASGDVYITDYAAKRILEFAHGGKKPIKKFNDSPDSPYTCAIDPLTGNLAVANDDGTSQQGNVAVWAAGSSKRTTYMDPNLYNFEGCAYNSRGDLLVTNGYSSSGAEFAWLPKGGSRFVDIYVPGPSPSWEWQDVLGIQWDGRYFAIDDGYSNGLYRVSLIHGQAYYVGMTSLYLRQTYPVGPFWIYNDHPGRSRQGTQVVGAFESVGGGSTEVEYFAYPAGGNSIASFTHGLDMPFGVTISLGKP